MGVTALEFVRRLLEDRHIPTRLMRPPDPKVELEADLGLRALVYRAEEWLPRAERFLEQCAERTVYYCSDEFHCSYALLRLPLTGELLLAGPYLLEELNHQQLLQIMESLNFPPRLTAQLEGYYRRVPFVAQEPFYSMMALLAADLFGGEDRFQVRFVQSFSKGERPSCAVQEAGQGEPALLRKILEERYELENRLLAAVRQGNVNKASELFGRMRQERLPQRVADPLRNQKNYLIILGTLLRKAAQEGGVHPMHIDKESSHLALIIERLTAVSQAAELGHEMVRRYCLLVRNHSLRGYPPLVRRVIDEIDTDLCADLSLKALSELFSINASYLSTVFRKETGATLTDFVNRRRVDHALLLLNSTTMQIQQVALRCGIPDLSYFTRVFKKVIGQTPREYRERLGRAPGESEASGQL